MPQVSEMRTPIVLHGLQCRPSNMRLDECERSTFVQTCSHSDDAGANCSPEKGWLPDETIVVHNANCNCPTSVCNDGEVQLVQFGEYQSENEGRAEFCESGLWGLVCYQTGSDDFWDNDDATVFCRQLGYDVERKISNTTQIFLH